MRLIERYVLKRTAQVFLLLLCALTAAAWVTQLLKRLDVVTAKGQALWVFLLMTASVLPAVIQVVAPIAFLIGVIVILNRMISDSELQVVAAAGASPAVVSRPIVTLGVLVTLGLVASYHVVAPAGLALLRTISTEVRSDVIASLVQDGSFHSLEEGLTMHFRRRLPDGTFQDVFISDARSPTESRTFSARYGQLIESASGPFLVLQHGDFVFEDDDRQDLGSFEAYAIDLRLIGSAGTVPIFKAIERSTFYLWSPPQGDPYSEANPLKVRAEIYERLMAPLYTLVFAFIALGYLGRPCTNRQDSTLAIARVVLLCVMFRAGGYAAFVLGRSLSEATAFIFVVPMVGLAFGIHATHNSAKASFQLRTIRSGINRLRHRLPGRDAVRARALDSA